MVGESIETRTGTPDVVRSRCHPSILACHVDQLVLIKCGERYVPRTALSLFFGHVYLWMVSFLKVSFQNARACSAYGQRV